jgi:hypothetical protein
MHRTTILVHGAFFGSGDDCLAQGTFLGFQDDNFGSQYFL